MEHHQLERPRIPTARRTPSIVRMRLDNSLKVDENVDYVQVDVPSKGKTVSRQQSIKKEPSNRSSTSFVRDPIRSHSLSRFQEPLKEVAEPKPEMKLAPEPPLPVRSSIHLDLAAGAVKAREASMLRKSSMSQSSRNLRGTPKWVYILGYPTTSEKLAEEKKWLSENAARLGDVPEEEVSQVIKLLEPFESLKQRFQATKKHEFQNIRAKMLRASSNRMASMRSHSSKEVSLTLG